VSGYLLDTNIASHVIRGDRPEISARLASLPVGDIAISTVTEGELNYGLAKRNHPGALGERVKQFLLRVDVLPWDRAAAQAYGELCAAAEAQGAPLASLNMMIAAHALAVDAVLVTRDKGFLRLPRRLKIEDWAAG
jgi:tRNA(fMet)-specific endonuclease VapC